MDGSSTQSDFSLDDRILCTDGTCVGVIGADGRCGVCKKIYEGDEPLPAGTGAQSRVDEPLLEDPVLVGRDDSSSVPDDPDQRILCDDDACIGIIGPDGKCGTCGRPSSKVPR